MLKPPEKILKASALPAFMIEALYEATTQRDGRGVIDADQGWEGHADADDITT